MTFISNNPARMSTHIGVLLLNHSWMSLSVGMIPVFLILSFSLRIKLEIVDTLLKIRVIGGKKAQVQCLKSDLIQESEVEALLVK